MARRQFQPFGFGFLHGHSRRSARLGKAMLIAILAIAVVGGGAYGYYRYTSESGPKVSDQPLLQTVARGPFDHIVLEQGEVDSSSNIDVNCEVKAKGTSGTGWTPRA